MSGNVKRKEGMERIKKAQEEHERAQRKEEARQQSGTQNGSFQVQWLTYEISILVPYS